MATPQSGQPGASADQHPQGTARALSGGARLRGLLRRAVRSLGPALPRPHLPEAVRAGLGAALALVISGGVLVLLNIWRGDVVSFMLIAPLGASAFLLFAVPNSPLAQPWSAVIGNGISALVAVGVLQIGLPSEVSAGLAVGFAILAMASLRAMHPPGGAVALASVLAAQDGSAVGLGFVLSPVLLDTVLLVALAMVYNRLTGRRYPFRQAGEAGVHKTSDAPPDRRLGLTPDDLAEVLDRFNLGANIGAEDFGRILAAAEAEAAQRHFAGLVCGAVMSRDIIAIASDTPIAAIAALFGKHRVETLPVVDGDQRLHGIVSQNDLIQRTRDWALLAQEGVPAGPPTPPRSPSRARTAGDIMTRRVRIVAPDDSIGVLVHVLADGGVQAAPVIEGGRLVGMVTRSDLLAALASQTVLAGSSAAMQATALVLSVSLPPSR